MVFNEQDDHWKKKARLHKSIKIIFFYEYKSRIPSSNFDISNHTNIEYYHNFYFIKISRQF